MTVGNDNEKLTRMKTKK